LNDSRREYRDDRRDHVAEHRDNRRYYGYDRHHDTREWRHEGHRFHGAANYGYPRGQQYQYWAPNVRLPRSYWGSPRYWINDPYRYQLIRPWAGTRWVQVGPDAILVSLRDGVVVSIVRGLFY
jgi:Ni/Co efflux regulator RcnB